MDKIKLNRNDYLLAIDLIDHQAAPMQINIDPIDQPIAGDIWIPMYNATTTGKVMAIIAEFLASAQELLFSNGLYSRPGIFKAIKLGYLTIKMIISIVESLKS